MLARLQEVHGSEKVLKQVEGMVRTTPSRFNVDVAIHPELQVLPGDMKDPAVLFNFCQRMSVISGLIG